MSNCGVNTDGGSADLITICSSIHFMRYLAQSKHTVSVSQTKNADPNFTVKNSDPGLKVSSIGLLKLNILYAQEVVTKPKILNLTILSNLIM